jgi:type II secretory ATPase GspE/PulE/Tfp pilus assembly ATPase PilB-like protein
MQTAKASFSSGQRLHQPWRASLLSEAVAQAPEEAAAAHTRNLAAALIQDAEREQASDIHLDPVGDAYDVRFRIEGLLVDVLRLPQEEGLRVVRAFKTQAELEPAFTFRPMEGRADWPVGERKVSVRVATGPGVAGEKLALRLLTRALMRPPLDQLGLSVGDYDAVTGALHEVRGMVLISGPTGSGKTTTLYAFLRHLQQAGRSIVTIEDPVEHPLEGVTQLEVNERQGLTYEEGVKGLLRLDPDVLVVGEMRDATSAHAALAAADSGHVFISTLHARDAAGTISVLRHFKLADHEIATSVDLLIAQRLVRRLCPACRRPEPPTAGEAQWLRLYGQPVPDKTWHPAGCAKCEGSGYRGRTGVFEIRRIREDDADLILAHADERAVRRHFRNRGSLSMLEDDLAKVAEGVTSIEEFRSLGGMGFFAVERVE